MEKESRKILRFEEEALRRGVNPRGKGNKYADKVSERDFVTRIKRERLPSEKARFDLKAEQFPTYSFDLRTKHPERLEAVRKIKQKRRLYPHSRFTFVDPHDLKD